MSDKIVIATNVATNVPSTTVTNTEGLYTIPYLTAGSYRVESRFGLGNAVASANVTVKPGLLSSVEIDHHDPNYPVTVAVRAVRPQMG